MSERFYLNWPLAPGPVELAGPEAHHLATVSRFRAGDPLRLFNGDGNEYPARVVATGRKQVTLEILSVERPDRELPFDLEVAAPLPKGDRGQFLVEKLTELGATCYVPLSTQRSVIAPREGKVEKLERYVIEASKQCGRNMLMRIEPVTSWTEYVRPARDGERRILAHRGGTDTAGAEMATHVRLAVGPEGGFTAEEVESAREHGWRFVDLGPRVLRIETAALVLAARIAISPITETVERNADK